ncbi:hypothetical protein T479_15325 [Lysinibacillus varians]|nr:hypothetical protein T479_15325 [Lysinibacillus varians]
MRLPSNGCRELLLDKKSMMQSSEFTVEANFKVVLRRGENF